MGKFVSDMDGSKFAPTAEIKTAGAMIKGILGEKRAVPSKYEKPYNVFSLKVIDADCKFVSDKQEVTPEVGTVVDVFAPTRLNNQLSKVAAGQTVTIKYLGTKKSGKGNPAHTFSVEVE